MIPSKLIPANGVYAVDVEYAGQTLGGMLNIGFRPTVAGTSQTIETYIFDFDKDIYGEHMTLRFREFLRPEQKFDGLPALVAQLKLDEEARGRRRAVVIEASVIRFVTCQPMAQTRPRSRLSRHSGN